jgi:hypothetical protein
MNLLLKFSTGYSRIVTLKDFVENNKLSEMNSDDDVISKLKFIGKIQKGEKINIRNISIQPDGLYTSLIRSFITLDNRKNTLNFIRNTVTRSFQLLHLYINSGTTASKNLCSNLILDIQKSKAGITNLKITYSSDVMLCCQLDTIIQEIEAIQSEIEEKYPEIFNHNRVGSPPDEF